MEGVEMSFLDLKENGVAGSRRGPALKTRDQLRVVARIAGERAVNERVGP
jgi:hypothetical protein